MCGIGLLASFPTTNGNESHDELLPDWNQRLSETLASRGPDVPCRQCRFSPGDINTIEHNDAALEELVTSTTDAAESHQWSATLHASVLHMRGQHPMAQPASFSLSPTFNSRQDARNCALCWNGECYTYDKMDGEGDGYSTECKNHIGNGNMVELISITTTEEKSDTILVTELVQDAIAQSQNSGTGEHEAIANAISRIHGEFSFILFVPSPSKKESNPSSISPSKGNNSYPSRPGYIYYGRDCLGRRSLLVNRSFGGVVVLSSVAMVGPLSTKDNLSNFNKTWEEIPPGIVYRLDTCTGEETSLSMPRVVNKDILDMAIPPILSSKIRQDTNGSSEQSTTKCTLEPLVIDETPIQRSVEAAANGLLKLLDKAVKRRVAQAPPPKSQSTSDASVAVLFSGGIDSVILAALSHRHVPSNQPIDLINVSFYKDADLGSKAAPTSPDRLAAILSYHEMLRRFPERRWKFIAVDVPYKEVLDQEKHILRLISPLDSTMDFNIATAFWFVGRGKGRMLGMDEVEDAKRGLENKVAVRNDTVPTSSQEPLLRFAKGDKTSNGKESSKTTCIREGCNNRTRSGCIFQACKFCCGKLQGPISSYLGKSARLCPTHNDGIGQQSNSNSMQRSSSKKREKTALAGAGKLPTSSPHSASNDRGKTNKSPITSCAKILLSGVGADEQMAGYGRHRTTYQRGGYEALRAELQMDVDRLWTRNLGRDDRCLSDHGKEARFPYLDEDVMTYLEALPLEDKCDMTRPLGEGDKLILRKVARMIGVMECSTLVKRAIQFGSRIAKVSDKSRFGSCRKATGQMKIVADKGIDGANANNL